MLFRRRHRGRQLAVGHGRSELFAYLGAGRSAGALLLVAAAGFLLPIRQWQESDQDPSAFEAPEIALDLKPRSGPIVVKDRIPDTGEQMSRLSWTRCGNDGECKAASVLGTGTSSAIFRSRLHWTETFRTPTWMDYLRLNHRLTAADKDLDQRLLELHMRELSPRTQLTIETTDGSRLCKRDQSTPFFFRL